MSEGFDADRLKELCRDLGRAMRKSIQEEYDKMGIPKGHPMRKIGPIIIKDGKEIYKIVGKF